MKISPELKALLDKLHKAAWDRFKQRHPNWEEMIASGELVDFYQDEDKANPRAEVTIEEVG